MASHFISKLIKANLEYRYALNHGKISKSSFCSKCGRQGKIDGHHDDYSKPLEVRFLCKRHHAEIHRVSPTITSDNN